MFILAAFPTYSQVLPGFEQAISGLRTHLLPVMSVLMVASLVGVAKEGSRAILAHLILLVILCGLAANWQPWFQQASTAVSTTFAGDQYSLSKQTERYLVKLQVKAEQKDADEGYVEAFFRAIMAGALLLIGYVTKGIVLLFLVLQQILLIFAYALSPIFVGFFALRSTRGIALNYLMTTVGLVSWPLGFALSACGTFGLVTFFTNAGFFTVGGNLLVLNEAFFALLVIAVWLLVSTVISPVIISKVMATGAQAGSALLAGVANTVAAATSAAVTSGATLAGGAAAGGAGAAASAGGGAPAASGGGSGSASAASGTGGAGAALRAATGAMLGGGASLVDAGMSGGNGNGAMSGAVASVLRGKSKASSASSANGGSQPQATGNGESSQTDTPNQPAASSSPTAGGAATPPPLPGGASGASSGTNTPANPTAPTGAPASASASGGTPILSAPQTPNHSGANPGSPAPTAPATSASVASTPAASSGSGSGTTSTGRPGSSGGKALGGSRKTAVSTPDPDTSLDGEVARIIDIATGKPVSGDSLPKPGN